MLSGRPTTLKAAVDSTCAGVCTWRWVPGDGSPAITGTVDADPFDPTQLDDLDYQPYWAVWAEHTYVGDPGDVFIASLRVSDGLEDVASAAYRVEIVPTALQREVNAALDEALWHVHRNQFRFLGTQNGEPGGTIAMGRWDYPQSFGQPAAAVTASSINAFEANGYLQSGMPSPYTETVRLGLRYLIGRLAAQPISVQTVGALTGGGRNDNPDANGNGVGVSVDAFLTFIEFDAPYQNGFVMGAIVASGTPAATAVTGGPGVIGERYGTIVRDMADWYAWAQSDSASHGGWQYNAFDNISGNHDNSASGWAAFGLVAASEVFGTQVPDWVRVRNENGLEFTDNESDVDDRDGIHGYSSTFELWGPFGVTGGAMVEMALDRIESTSSATPDERWIRSENYFVRHFDDDATSNNLKNYYYGMFHFAKAMRLAWPAPVIDIGTQPGAAQGGVGCGPHSACAVGGDASLDWYNDRRRGLARTVVDYQILPGDPDTEIACGAVQPGPCPNIGGFTDRPLNSQGSSQDDFNAPWGTLILTRTVLVPGPVALGEARPRTSAEGVQVTLDGSRSYHQSSAGSLALYEWDYDNDGVFDATGAIVKHRFRCRQGATIPCKVRVMLRVTDAGDPALTAADPVIIELTAPPHPPVAVSGRAYLACVDEGFALDGTASFDIDAGMSDTGLPPFDEIRAYAGDLNLAGGAPFDVIAATVARPHVRFTAAGTRDIALRVTDNTSLAFPSAGQPDLSDSDATTVNVVDCTCMGPIVARLLAHGVRLLWAPVAGAASYDVYRSGTGPNAGFALRADDVVTDVATFVDAPVTGGDYWYRITPHDAAGAELCGSSRPVEVTVASEP